MTTRDAENQAPPRPGATEYADGYAGYVGMVPDGEIVTTLRDQGRALCDALARVPESHAGHRYAEGKWSIREVVGHLIDAERIFAYRALRIARGDATPRAGFDENAFTAAAGSDARTLADLVDELRVVRDASVRLFASLPAEAWPRMGTASERPVSVRALAFITAGHAMHHLHVLRERYLA